MKMLAALRDNRQNVIAMTSAGMHQCHRPAESPFWQQTKHPSSFWILHWH